MADDMTEIARDLLDERDRLRAKLAAAEQRCKELEAEMEQCRVDFVIQRDGWEDHAQAQFIAGLEAAKATLWERIGREEYGHAKAAVALDIEAIDARIATEQAKEGGNDKV